MLHNYTVLVSTVLTVIDFFYKNEIPTDVQDKELKRYIAEELV